MSRAELLVRVRELRARGLSPKQVARELGMKPAEVAPLLRQVAGTQRGLVVERPLPEPDEREVVGCWVNPGWSEGLGLDQVPEWAAADPQGQGTGETLTGGLAGVMVARADRSSRVTVCGWLVDVFCLGVKDALGPKTISSGALFEHSRTSMPPSLTWGPPQRRARSGSAGTGCRSTSPGPGTTRVG